MAFNFLFFLATQYDGLLSFFFPPTHKWRGKAQQDQVTCTGTPDWGVVEFDPSY